VTISHPEDARRRALARNPALSAKDLLNSAFL
jgi:hypothetical protein